MPSADGFGLTVSGVGTRIRPLLRRVRARFGRREADRGRQGWIAARFHGDAMDGTFTPTPPATGSPRLSRRFSPPAEPPRAWVAIHKIAANFAALTAAEILCRVASVLVTLALTRRLGTAGNGRIEFSFNVVFWLVLLVRDGLEVIAAREIARHGKLVRSLVGHVLAIKGMLATILYVALVVVGSLTIADPAETTILRIYGLLLFTTALGLGLRLSRHRAHGPDRRVVGGSRDRLRDRRRPLGVRFPQDRLGSGVFGARRGGRHLFRVVVLRETVRLAAPVLERYRSARLAQCGGSIYMIQIAQAVIGSIDLLIVGLLSRYQDIGLYCIPHRMATFVLTFGLIAQQAIFPALSRGWRDRPDSARRP